MSPEVQLALVAGLLGLFFGSFFNVCIWRIPRRRSIVAPPSACPKCRSRIRIYDNIPVISFLLLRGRCRQCRSRISPRYPLVEMLTGLVFAALALRFGPGPEFVRGVIFAGFLVVLAFIDLDHQVVPDVVSLPGIAAGLASSLLVPGTIVPALRGLVPALLGGALGALIIWLARTLWLKLVRREGMGSGDIPLAALLGTFLGSPRLLLVLFLLAPGLGIMLGGGMAILRRRRVFGRHIPFGPFLALAGLIAYVAGDALLRLWLGR
jgi:leader peptidase (prepilin peptidase)/N-methyltransferase